MWRAVRLNLHGWINSYWPVAPVSPPHTLNARRDAAPAGQGMCRRRRRFDVYVWPRIPLEFHPCSPRGSRQPEVQYPDTPTQAMGPGSLPLIDAVIIAVRAAACTHAPSRGANWLRCPSVHSLFHGFTRYVRFC